MADRPRRALRVTVTALLSAAVAACAPTPAYIAPATAQPARPAPTIRTSMVFPDDVSTFAAGGVGIGAAFAAGAGAAENARRHPGAGRRDIAARQHRTADDAAAEMAVDMGEHRRAADLEEQHAA